MSVVSSLLLMSNFSTEMRFAYKVECLLNSYGDPVYKQITVEFFSVLSKIMKRHPEIKLIERIDVDVMIEQSMKIYAEVSNVCDFRGIFQSISPGDFSPD